MIGEVEMAVLKSNKTRVVELVRTYVVRPCASFLVMMFLHKLSELQFCVWRDIEIPVHNHIIAREKQA